MLLEKMQAFAENRYDITNVPGAQIAADYEAKRSDAWETIESMGITSRLISTCTQLSTSRPHTPQLISLRIPSENGPVLPQPLPWPARPWALRFREFIRLQDGALPADFDALLRRVVQEGAAAAAWLQRVGGARAERDDGIRRAAAVHARCGWGRGRRARGEEGAAAAAAEAKAGSAEARGAARRRTVRLCRAGEYARRSASTRQASSVTDGR